MNKKTEIEKIVDGIELIEGIKKEDQTIVKENKLYDWSKALEDSPYNQYYGIDMKCALVLMKAIKRGLKTKDAMYISEHHYKVPVDRTRNLLYKYSDEGEKFYIESSDLERKGFNKENAALKLKLANKKQ